MITATLQIAVDKLMGTCPRCYTLGDAVRHCYSSRQAEGIIRIGQSVIFAAHAFKDDEAVLQDAIQAWRKHMLPLVLWWRMVEQHYSKI